MASARDTLAQPQRDAQPQGGLWDVRPGHPVVRDPQVLHPHPLYMALCGPIAAIRAQRVAADDGPIREPLTITADGTILDGHARWQVACQRRDSSLPCLVYDLTTEDALQLLVQRHRSVQGLNAYGRIVLALQLEPHFRGQQAGRVDARLPPSMLTKGSHVDVRADIARVAGVSTGNVSKVKQILHSGIREVRECLVRGEVSIHRAWQWPHTVAEGATRRPVDASAPWGHHAHGQAARPRARYRTPPRSAPQRARHRAPEPRHPQRSDPHCRRPGRSRPCRARDPRALRGAAAGRSMTPPPRTPLRDVLSTHRDLWDHDDVRPSVREAFAKVTACRTPALGAEVFASAQEERTVYHTCKSRACPSCGVQATRQWQRGMWRTLPDVSYAHVCFTMPDVLWPLFQRNRHLLHDLPVLGAQVLQQWARQKHGIRLMIVVIPHTFGRHLNFNCHLHILVSEGGLREDSTQWCARVRLDRKALMPMWRYAVITLLREAARAGVLDTDMSRSELLRLLTAPVRTVVEHRRQAVPQ